MNYAEIRKINVNDHIEKKNGLSYLSWAWVWDIFKQHYPDAEYQVIKSDDGIPYFETSAGAMVYTEVTAGGLTHEMWLPVMDGANNAMKAESYEYDTKYGKKTVAAFDMFDVNKTIMRCLVKNLAMFGLGIYIYAGEDLPDDDKVHAPTQSITPTAGALDNSAGVYPPFFGVLPNIFKISGSVIFIDCVSLKINVSSGKFIGTPPDECLGPFIL